MPTSPNGRRRALAPSGRWLAGIAVLALALVAHLAWPAVVGLGEAVTLAAGLALGLALSRRPPASAGPQAGPACRDTAVVVQDIQTLHHAFAVLRQQVATTMHTSEDAVLSMLARIHRVQARLAALRGPVEADVAAMTADIVGTLGDMQFQDITRQSLEQIDDTLASLSDHFAQLDRLLSGASPPPPLRLEALMARWKDDYVMHSQRAAHDRALAGTAAAARPAQAPAADAPAAIDTAPEPRIEFF